MALQSPNWELMLQASIGAATVAATIALVIFTRVLAKETRRLSDATSQPLVVATIEPDYIDLIQSYLCIENTGNAPAFDVCFKSEPPIPFFGDETIESKSVDVMRPSQRLTWLIATFKELASSSYDIKLSWKKSPQSIRTEGVSYRIDMRKFDGLSRPETMGPILEIARELRRCGDDWREVSRGDRKIKVEMFPPSSGHDG